MINFQRSKSLILFLISVSIVHQLQAQVNYVNGYVITKGKDSLKGYVDFRNWQNNPTQINFKTSLDKDPVVFYPGAINEFGIQGRKFVSGIVEVEITSLTLSELAYDPTLKTRTDTAFLQALFTGNKELYYYNNAKGRINFYIRKNGQFELLLYKKYLELQQGKGVIREHNEFIRQLSLYLNDCKTIQSVLKNTSYNRKNLYSLFQYYYKCVASEPLFIQKQAKPYFKIGGLVGGSLTSLKFKSNSFTHLVNSKYSPSFSPQVGIAFDLVFPGKQEKWSFNNELLYSPYRLKGVYTDFTHDNLYEIHNTEFAYSYLKLNSLIRYKHPIGKVFMFFNAGISNGLAISETNNDRIFKKFYTEESITDEPALEATRQYEQGILLGAGVRSKKLTFELRYENGNGMSVNSALTSTTTRYHFLVGYSIR